MINVACGCPRALGLVLAAGLAASTASGAQIVFLNFGSDTETQTKTNNEIYKENGDLSYTLVKNARRGYRPVDLGYANNNDRAAQINAIVAQVTADYTTGGNPYNISFVTTRPANGTYSTVNVVEGNFPNFRVPFGANTMLFDLAAQRITVESGPLTGYYLDLVAKNVKRANGTVVPGISFEDFGDITRPDRTLGIAQHVDVGNKDKGKQAWAFIGSHNAGSSSLSTAQRQTELANTISHELGHLLGLSHADGTTETIMNGNYDGANKAFGDAEHKKLKAVLAPKDAPPRERKSKVGDTDQHGTSKPAPLMPDASLDDQAIAAFKQARQVLQPGTADNLLYNLADIRASDSEDGGYTDRMLSNFTTATFNIQLEEPGLGDTLFGAWLEMDVMNVVDTLGGASDMRLIIEGLEVPGAFDGMDQRTGLPSGFAASDRVTFFLDDHFSLPVLQGMYADGFLDVEVLVNGASQGVSIDGITLITVDVPAPSAGALLTGAGCLALRRRRRQTA